MRSALPLGLLVLVGSARKPCSAARGSRRPTTMPRRLTDRIRTIGRASAHRRLGRRNARPQDAGLAAPAAPFSQNKAASATDQTSAALAFGSMDPIRQARHPWPPRVRAVRCGSGGFMANAPALELVQPRADGANRHPAVKAVGRLGREQEAAVSGRGPPARNAGGARRLSTGPARRRGNLRRCSNHASRLPSRVTRLGPSRRGG